LRPKEKQRLLSVKLRLYAKPSGNGIIKQISNENVRYPKCQLK
jgi:hypothetical protein